MMVCIRYVHILWCGEPLSAEAGFVSFARSLGAVVTTVRLAVTVTETAVLAAPHGFLPLRLRVEGSTALPSLHRRH